MKQILSLLTAGLIALAVSAHASKPADDQSVLIHLSKYTNELHAVNMALKVGHLLAENGAKVTLFLDLEGVRLADKSQPQNLVWGSGDSVDKLYTRYVDAGGTVLVCPHCAKAAGVTELRAGAVIADQDSLLRAISGADKILDY